VTYPPEPWYLGGGLLVSLFRVPTADLPPVFAAGPKPRILGRYTVLGAAFARYRPGGVLAYDELLVATPTLDRGRLRVTIPQIWVDSPESLEGGRALWAIPKELGGFERAETTDAASVSMSTDDGPVAGLEARIGRTLLPGMRQIALPILQPSPTGRVLSHNRVIGRIRALSPTWTFDPHGPLGYLAGHRPFASFALGDASIIFGMDVQRS
jgi:hypothetical protein